MVSNNHHSTFTWNAFFFYIARGVADIKIFKHLLYEIDIFVMRIGFTKFGNFTFVKKVP